MSSFQKSNKLITTEIKFQETELTDINIPILFEDKELEFGIFKIKIADVSITKKKIILNFTIDISGSMSDGCGDGRSKMDHTIHCIVNIIDIIAKETNITVLLRIDGFDEKIENIITLTEITLENCMELINIVKRIIPRGGTNIELALLNTKKEMDILKDKYPDYSIIHLLSSDGNANVGSTDIKYLNTLIDESYGITTFGFGIDHSSETLSMISSGLNSFYYFVDKMENSPIVFGVVIHHMLYELLRDIEIKITDGEIYNYRTNTWSDVIKINSLTGDSESILHIRSKSPFDINIELFGINNLDNQENKVVKICDTIYFPSLISLDPTIPTFTNIIKYIFRQRTQELIFESLNKYKNKDFKTVGNSFIKSIKNYLENNILTIVKEDIDFFNSLCDDIYIIVRTCGTLYANTFAVSRGNSNGREESYNATTLPEEYTTPRQFGRQITNTVFGFPPPPGRLTRQTSCPMPSTPRHNLTRQTNAINPFTNFQPSRDYSSAMSGLPMNLNELNNPESEENLSEFSGMDPDEDENVFNELEESTDLNGDRENIHQLNLNPITNRVTPRAATLIRSVSK